MNEVTYIIIYVVDYNFSIVLIIQGPPSGSAGCGQTGESCSSNTGCSGDQLLMCNGGTWTGMPCAPGTVCRVSDGQGFCVEASTPGYQAC